MGTVVVAVLSALTVTIKAIGLRTVPHEGTAVAAGRDRRDRGGRLQGL